MELEQQTSVDSNIVHEPDNDCPERISGLQALLEGAPSLPERRLSWHHTFETVLDGTREGSIPIVCDGGRRLKSTTELHARMEELERLKDQMDAVGMSIVQAVGDGTLSRACHTDPFPSGNLYS